MLLLRGESEGPYLTSWPTLSVMKFVKKWIQIFCFSHIDLYLLLPNPNLPKASICICLYKIYLLGSMKTNSFTVLPLYLFLSNSLLALICLVSFPLSFSLFSLSEPLISLPFSNFFVWSATVRTQRSPSQQQEKKKAANMR